jgi:uncharacterized protein YhfF
MNVETNPQTQAVTLRGLVLDRMHHVLLDGEAPLEVQAERPSRPLAALRAGLHERYGLSLPFPIGAGPRAGALYDFAFMIDKGSVAEGGLRWWPLAEALRLGGGAGQWVWEAYVTCLLGGWVPPTRELDVFFFGDGPELASKLAHLVVCGQKRATAGWKRAAEREGTTVPHAGLVSIVTDGFGAPRCAIVTDEVNEVPFRQVDAAFAAREGEGDHTLGDWREGHLAYFRREAERLGLSFDEDEIVMLESFRVLHVFGTGAAEGGAR